MSEEQATDPSASGRSTAARRGRLVGIVLFWLGAAYVVGASAASVIPSLYWPDSAPLPRAAGVTRCADQLASLEQGLLTRAGTYLREPRPQELSRFLAEWDARWLKLSGGCGPLEPARVDLSRLRSDVEHLLRRYERDQGPVRERIERLLASYQETTSS